MTDPQNVVRRFLAGPVVPLKPRKPSVPTLAIGGQKYALSTDGGILGDREDDEALQKQYGDQLILNPGANKWRYLWAYDTETQTLAMWRVSDGSEKFWGSARSETALIVKLDKKGQLNRVSRSEMTKIDAHMKGVEKAHEAALAKLIEENKGDRERAIDRELGAMWAKLRPRLLTELDAVQKGATPIGFKPFRPENVERQAATYVIGEFFKRHFDYEKTADALGKKIPSLNPELAGHYQDVMWAIDDLRDKQYEALLPPR